MWDYLIPPTIGVEVANRRFEARNRGLPDAISRLFSNKADLYRLHYLQKLCLIFFTAISVYFWGRGSHLRHDSRSGEFCTTSKYLYSFPSRHFTYQRPGLPNLVSFISNLEFDALPAALSKGPELSS